MRRAVPFLIVIWLMGAIQASAGITARFDTNLSSGPSPLAVSFNATATSHSSSSINTNRFHELLYMWDYDDPDSGTWNTTGKSRNNMTGPLGAHVFEPSSFPDCGGSCKIYSVQLTVKDALGNSSIKTQNITVYDPDDSVNGWGASGKSICISKSGNFSGCPGVATRETNSGTLNSILSSKIAAGYRRILFHAGEAWSMTGTYTLSANGPGLVGAYGSGKFTINFGLGDTDAFRLGGDYWRIQDIHFAGSSTAALFLGSGQLVDCLIQRTTSNPNSFRWMVNLAVNFLPAGAGDSSIHRHFFLVDNVWQALINPTGKYQFFGAVWGLNILGNELKDVYEEHNIRVQTGEAVLVSNNKLGPQHRVTGASVLQLRDLPSSCTAVCPRPFCGRENKYFLVQDNDFQCDYAGCIQATMRTCAGGESPGLELASEDFVFERNSFRRWPGGSKATGAAIYIGYGASRRFVVRNNILDETGWEWATGFQGQTGAKFQNNTCFRSDSLADGKAICITPGGADECRNNVMYAPNWTGSVLGWKHPNGGSCASASNNFDNGDTGNLTSNPFVSGSPITRANFTPKAGGPLIDSAKAVAGVFDDSLGNCRTGAPDAGAIERGASESCAGVATPVIPDDPDSIPETPVLLP